jgi:hypothetical protein
MAVLSRFFHLYLAAVSAASPTTRRSTVASDKLVGLPASVPSGTVGTVYKAYLPYLYVVNGCVPFPAVDSSGNTKFVPSASLLFELTLAVRD